LHDTRPLAIALMGPTASGKTALALDWAARLGTEVVSVDSALVYRGLDIGAAKPTAGELARVRHHLVDVRDPHEVFSAADFAREALPPMQALAARGRVPLLVGGTGLYFSALLDGLSELPTADPALRAAIAAEGAARGWPALHAEMAAADPAAGQRIGRCSGSPVARSAPGRPNTHASRSRSACCGWCWPRPTAPCCTNASPAASTRCSPPASSTRWGA
jgi:tRNA dimethylallyltransferase